MSIDSFQGRGETFKRKSGAVGYAKILIDSSKGDLSAWLIDDPYKKDKTAYLARLSPRADEVWEIRSRDPTPAIRVFGRFAICDTFIAFNWGYRKDLGGLGSKEFRFEINRAKSEWKKIFPTYQPVSGADIHDYVSEECFPA
jgi:hypothetical protein